MGYGRNGTSAAEMLVEFIEGIELLEEQKRQIVDRIRDKKAQAKTAGFDTKVMNAILRERRMSPGEREEFQALCEMYRAALGMLNGTPLGEAARRRLMGEKSPPPPPAGEGEAPDAPQPNAEPEAPALDLDGARTAGRDAAREGKRIIDNPFTAADPRRAAWDEGWCAETGSDGMDIPEAWRRADKRKKNAKGDGKPDGDGGDDA